MSTIFQTPVALITLITEDRVWFKVRCRLLSKPLIFFCVLRAHHSPAVHVSHRAAHCSLTCCHHPCLPMLCPHSLHSAPGLQSKVGPFGACVTREGSWCNYISVPNTPEGKGWLSSRAGWDGVWWLGRLCGQGCLCIAAAATAPTSDVHRSCWIAAGKPALPCPSDAHTLHASLPFALTLLNYSHYACLPPFQC